MRALDAYDPASTYAAVLDALPVVAYIADPDGTISYLSRGWERFTGNDASAVLQRGYSTVVHPDDLPRVALTWDTARLAGAAYRDTFRLRFGDGSYRRVVSQADPMHGPGGAISGWFGTLTDIEELRRAEDGTFAALEASRKSAREAAAQAEFTERLLDASDDCIKVLDLGARLVSMSANGQKALAIMDFASVEGANWLEFWHSDEDRRAAGAAVAAALTGGRGRFTGFFAVEGRAKWWDVTVTPIVGPDGRPERLLAVSRDVTETLLVNRALARSEERYRVLGEALPGVTWTATPDGLLDYISGEAPAPGLSSSDRLGDAWLQKVHPAERDAVRSRWQAALASGEPYDAQFRVLMADGNYRWQLVRGLPQRDLCGTIVRWVGVNVDIDDQRRSDEAREQFVRLVEASDDFIGIADERGNVTYVNEAGRGLLEIGTPDAARATKLMDYFLPEDRAFVESEIFPTVAREGRWAGEFPLRHFGTGETVPVWYKTFSLTDDAGESVGTATVGRDLRERRRVEVGMRALAETGAAMYGSLDFEGTIRNVADAVVRSFSSFCVVDVVGGDGSIRSIAAAHRNHAAVTLLERAAGTNNDNPDHPVARALRNGESTLIATLPADWLETSGMRDAFGPELERLGLRSLIFVPIPSSQSGRIYGALTCVLDARDQRGTFTAEDLLFAKEIAVRAGLAFDHAHAYERERRIAVTLQEASLPRILPAVDHLYLSAEYRPGNSEATIGGDWYDAFLLDDGRIAITVGDVLGSGLGAAVTMGKVRQSMRSAATLIASPNAMLDVADGTVRAESADTYATALAGIFDPDTHVFTFASAGHPGPVMRHPDGRIEEFTAHGILLGLRARGETKTVTVHAPPGSSLVFFTDGLVEATRDIFEGHRRLHAAMADENVAACKNTAQALVEHVLGGPATDDVAVLVAEIGPSARFDERLRTAQERARENGTPVATVPARG